MLTSNGPTPKRHTRRRIGGVTLVELVATLGIVAMLAALAVPTFTDMRRNSERAAAVNSFLHAVFLARSEAIKRGTIVSLCKSPDGDSCTNRAAEWTAGWMVFVNTDRDRPPERDEGEPILAVYQGWARGRITSNRTAYSFRPYTQGVVNGTVLFCDPRGGEHARALIVSRTGRPRVSRRDASNKPLRC